MEGKEMKTIETVSTTRTNSIIEEGTGRSATIVFRDGVFERCSYGLIASDHHSLDDWHFLGLVAQMIGELAKEKPVTDDYQLRA